MSDNHAPLLTYRMNIFKIYLVFTEVIYAKFE